VQAVHHHSQVCPGQFCSVKRQMTSNSEITYHNEVHSCSSFTRLKLHHKSKVYRLGLDRYRYRVSADTTGIGTVSVSLILAPIPVPIPWTDQGCVTLTLRSPAALSVASIIGVPCNFCHTMPVQAWQLHLLICPLYRMQNTYIHNTYKYTDRHFVSCNHFCYHMTSGIGIGAGQKYRYR